MCQSTKHESLFWFWFFYKGLLYKEVHALSRVLKVLKISYIYYEFITHSGNTFNPSKGLHRVNEQSLANRAALNICTEPSVCTSWICTHRAQCSILKSLSDLDWGCEANPTWPLPHWNSFNFPRACSIGAAKSDSVEFTQPHSEDPSVVGEHWGPHFTNIPKAQFENCDQYTDRIKEEEEIKTKQTGKTNYLLHIGHSNSIL